MSKKYILPLLLIASKAFAGASEVDAIVKEAVRSFSSINSVPEMTPTAQVMGATQCIASLIVWRGGLLFVAQDGRGLVVCRTPEGWSAPSFIRFYGGAFGLAAGLTKARLVVMFPYATALEDASADDWIFGTQSELQFGPIGIGFSAARTTPPARGLYVYTDSTGLYLGISLEGLGYRTDLESNAFVYGPQATAAAILSTPLQNSVMAGQADLAAALAHIGN